MEEKKEREPASVEQGGAARGGEGGEGGRCCVTPPGGSRPAGGPFTGPPFVSTDDPAWGGASPDELAPNELERPLHLVGVRRGKGRRLVRKDERRPRVFTPEQRLLVLDTWKRSGLSAKAFSGLVGVSHHTLHWWRQKFEEMGPGGLVDGQRGGPSGSRLAELARRSILMLKEANPEWGCQRISDMLARGPGLPASAAAVAKVLHEAGYELEEVESRPHREQVRRFERARPNQMWMSDLFTFILRRQNRRVYLVAFLDDHSRFITGYGLWASASTALVIETLRAAISAFRAPEEVLTDNGPQYVVWRGKSAFGRELDKQGIKHLVSSPRRPQTLGKVERFWGSLWRECVETAVFLDMEDARRRVGLYIDGYNFHRPHQGIGGLCPADRFFGAAPEVLKTLRARVAANAIELARHGVPRKQFYLTGQVGGKSFSVYAAGERVFMKPEGKEKEEIELGGMDEDKRVEGLPEPVTPSVPGVEPEDEKEAPPGASTLDEALERIAEALGEKEGGER